MFWKGQLQSSCQERDLTWMWIHVLLWKCNVSVMTRVELFIEIHINVKGLQRLLSAVGRRRALTDRFGRAAAAQLQEDPSVSFLLSLLLLIFLHQCNCALRSSIPSREKHLLMGLLVFTEANRGIYALQLYFFHCKLYLVKKFIRSLHISSH